jgi:hypothetical protein
LSRKFYLVTPILNGRAAQNEPLSGYFLDADDRFFKSDRGTLGGVTVVKGRS